MRSMAPSWLDMQTTASDLHGKRAVMLVDDDPQVGGATTTKEEEPTALDAKARAARMVEDFMLRLILVLEQKQRAGTQGQA